MTISKEAIESLAAALEPFAAVAEHDIGTDETATDFFAPMKEYNRAPRLLVGDLRLAKSALDTFKQEIAPALSTLPIAVEGKVKPLVWEYREQQMMTYVVRDYRGIVYHINQTFGSDSYYFTTVKFDGSILYDGDDLPSAQAAAQADHDTFILSALISSPGKDGGQEVEAVARWLVEEELPSGSKRWEVFEHELHARNVAARYNHRNKTTVTPLYTRPQPASTALIALREIAAEQNVYLGHGDYDTIPALTAEEAQSVARSALASTQPDSTALVEKGGSDD